MGLQTGTIPPQLLRGQTAAAAEALAAVVVATAAGRVFSVCSLQKLVVACNVAALCQLGERDIGGNDADEQREKARG